MENKKKLKKRVGASFMQKNKRTDKPAAEKIGPGTNSVSGPTNRADDVLKNMMKSKPSGMKQIDRKKK